MAFDDTTDDDGLLKPAGPDTIQRFNSARLVVVAVVAVIASSVYLVGHISAGTSTTLPVVAVGGSVILLIFALWFARRFWVKVDGVTIDEADPRRTPEQQRARDDRVRANNAELTPRQEVLAGIVLIPVGLAWAFFLGLREADGGDVFFGLGIAALGIFLLGSAALARLRHRP